MKDNFDGAIKALEEFKVAVQDESIISVEQIMEVINHYEKLIQKLIAYQDILNDHFKN